MPPEALISELVAAIAAQLDETEAGPIEEIRRIVVTIGPEPAAVLVRCALRLEVLGGCLKNDGQRRTVGGIFFCLAHGIANRRQRRQIWHAKQTEAAGDESAASIHSQDVEGFVMERDTSIIGPSLTVVNVMEKTRPYNESKSPRRA